MEDIIEHDEWEVRDLWHDGKHEKRLSIRKDSDHRWTYCMTCGISRKFVQKPAEGTEQQLQPDNGYVCNRPGSCAKGQGGRCYSGFDCPDKAIAG